MTGFLSLYTDKKKKQTLDNILGWNKLDFFFSKRWE